MMTSILFVDAQALQSRPGGAPAPSVLADELTNTMHGLSREIRSKKAYCAPSVDLTTRCAYRDAGFEIVDSSGSEETLVRTTMDLIASIERFEDTQEVILLGRSNYTPLLQLLRERKILISVADRPDLTPSIEALADGVIDIDEIIQSGLAKSASARAIESPLAVPTLGLVSSLSARPQEDAADQIGDENGAGEPQKKRALSTNTAAILTLVDAEDGEAKGHEPTTDVLIDEGAEPVQLATAEEVSPSPLNAHEAKTDTTEGSEPVEKDGTEDRSRVGSKAETAAEEDLVAIDFEDELEAEIVAFVAADQAKRDVETVEADGLPATAEKDDTVTSEPEASEDDDEVDVLLTRLMSDGVVASASGGTSLDVVPER